jgi:hypothetical protein
MSETLTMNETPADQPQFNADEQDSLQVAESLEGGEQPLLAGKFKDSGELEKAYLELQSKLGEPRDEVQTTEDEGEPAEQEQEEEVAEESETEFISKEQADQLMDMVGGEKAYQSMMQWAGQNLSKEEIEMYDSVMGKGDPSSIFFAVQALNSKYSDSVGSDGQMLTGRDGSSDSKAFRSQAELVEAMSDPRYDRDPAYRRDVISRLENSDVQF